MTVKNGKMNIVSVINIIVALAAAPLLLGIINRTKAVFAGRTGKPLLQVYYDVFKLLGKGAVYSNTTTWIFRAGPAVGLAASVAAMLLVPMSGAAALVAFPGDFVLLAYLLGVARFFTVIAALDTGSAFEGMGASREATFSIVAEPALFLGLAALARKAGSFSLSGMLAGVPLDKWGQAGPVFVLVAGSLFIIALSENSRIPVDDPNTHLELTMIHEVMVLDHGGPDFAFILYASSLKLWIFGALVVCTLVPMSDLGIMGLPVFIAAMAVFGIMVGTIESSMGRLKMMRVPQFLVSAAALSAFALFISM